VEAHRASLGLAAVRRAALQEPGYAHPEPGFPKQLSAIPEFLPGLRIRYASPGARAPQEVFFQTRPLLEEMVKTPLCQ